MSPTTRKGDHSKVKIQKDLQPQPYSSNNKENIQVYFREESVGDAVNVDDARNKFALPLDTHAAVHITVPKGQSPDIEPIAPFGDQDSVDDELEVGVGHCELVDDLGQPRGTCWEMLSM